MSVVDLANVRLEAGWKAALAEEFRKPYFAQIKTELLRARDAGETIFPPARLIFNAFEQTPFDKVRVVILGQDPYHNVGQAMGLSFSVPQGVRIPPSLLNIYKELERTIPGYQRPAHGDLSAWAAQGVLLLNASLTVLQGQAGSHAQIGWQQFTDAAIAALSARPQPVIFLLWGAFAKKKADLINPRLHHILTAPHPSPLARGFIGCGHFADTNRILQERGELPIQW